MTKLNFDEHIREQFNNYAPDVRPELWDQIVNERERRKPKGFWFALLNNRNLLLLAVLLIAAGTGAYLYFRHTGPATIDTNNAIAANGQKTEDIKTVLPSTDQLNPASPANSGGFNNNPAPDNNNNDVTITSPANQTTGISSPLPNYNQRPGNNTSLLLFGDGTNDPTNNKRTSKGKLTINTIDGNTTGDPDAIDNSVGGTLMSRLFFGVQKIRQEHETNTTLRNRNMPNVFLPGCPTIEQNAAGNKRYFEIYAGPDYAFRSFSDTGNSAYLKKRKESTQFSSAFSAGVRYTKVFGNGVSIRTGINYSQINEKFSLVQGNLVQVTYIINANGDTTGSYTVTGTRYKTTYNKYKSIDVPLMVGYELGNGRLHANLNAGVVINAYSWQKGDVVDTANQPVSITTGKTNSPYQFKTNAGIGFMGAVSVYYKLNDRVHILAEPYYRHNFSPMNKDNITLKQKYSTAGLRLGIRIDLP